MSDKNKNIDIDFDEINDLFNLKIEEDDTDIDTESDSSTSDDNLDDIDDLEDLDMDLDEEDIYIEEFYDDEGYSILYGKNNKKKKNKKKKKRKSNNNLTEDYSSQDDYKQEEYEQAEHKAEEHKQEEHKKAEEYKQAEYKKQEEHKQEEHKKAEEYKKDDYKTEEYKQEQHKQQEEYKQAEYKKAEEYKQAEYKQEEHSSPGPTYKEEYKEEHKTEEYTKQSYSSESNDYNQSSDISQSSYENKQEEYSSSGPTYKEEYKAEEHKQEEYKKEDTSSSFEYKSESYSPQSYNNEADNTYKQESKEEYKTEEQKVEEHTKQSYSNESNNNQSSDTPQSSYENKQEEYSSPDPTYKEKNYKKEKYASQNSYNQDSDYKTDNYKSEDYASKNTVYNTENHSNQSNNNEVIDNYKTPQNSNYNTENYSKKSSGNEFKDDYRPLNSSFNKVENHTKQIHGNKIEEGYNAPKNPINRDYNYNNQSNNEPINRDYNNKDIVEKVPFYKTDNYKEKTKELVNKSLQNNLNNTVLSSSDGPVINVRNRNFVIYNSPESLGKKKTINNELNVRDLSPKNEQSIINYAANGPIIKGNPELRKYINNAKYQTQNVPKGSISPSDDKNIDTNLKVDNIKVDGKSDKAKEFEYNAKAKKQLTKKLDIGKYIIDIGNQGYRQIIKPLNESEVADGYYEVSKYGKPILEVVSLVGGNTFVGNELNKLNDIKNFGEFISQNNNIDFYSLSAKEFALMEKKANVLRVNASSPKVHNVRDMKTSVKAISKSQLVKLEKAKNFVYVQNLFKENATLFTNGEGKQIQKGDIFKFTSKTDITININSAFKLLKRDEMLAKSGIEAFSLSKLKNMLKKPDLSLEQKELLKYIITMKGAQDNISNMNLSKRKLLSTAKNAVANIFKEGDLDAVNGLSMTSKSLKAGSKVTKYSSKIAYKTVNNNATRFVGRQGLKGGKFVGRQALKGGKFISNKTGLTKIGNKTADVINVGRKGIVKGVNKAFDNKAGKVIKSVGRGTSKGVRMVGKGTNTVIQAPRKLKIGFRNMRAKTINKIKNSAVGKAVGVALKPFSLLMKGFNKLKIFFSTIYKIILGIFGGVIITILVLGFIMPPIITSIVGIFASSTILDAENVAKYVNHINLLEVKQEEKIEDVKTKKPVGKDVIGNDIPKYGADDSDGITIMYVDKNGNEVVNPNNSKDILTYLTLYLQQDFDLKEEQIFNMLDDLYDITHPEFILEESDIYFCNYGCDEISYICYEMVGVEPYCTYSSRIYNQYGCNPIVTPVYSYDSGCQSIEFSGEIFTYCPGHFSHYDYEARCSSHHTQSICYGHRDVTVKVPVLFLQDLIDMNYHIRKKNINMSSNIYDVMYNNKLDDIKDIFIESGEWNEENTEIAWNIYNQDWYQLYDVVVGNNGLYTEENLPKEIQTLILSYLDGNITADRYNMVKLALESVGQIPYYWGGKPKAAGWNNGFGSITNPDEKGRNRIGLDCSGYINWLYWTITGDDLGNGGTGNIWSKGTFISSSLLEPGDVAFLQSPSTSGTNHIGLYIGTDEFGRKMWIHENGTANNVSLSYDYTSWTYFMRILPTE